MADVYRKFLATQSPALLAGDASLHYVTTLTSFPGSERIASHLAAQQKQVTKKNEEIISAVQGQNVAVFEVDTSLEFVTSGGAYLPGLDDNFVSDRTAQLTIIHFVTFDSNGNISQIRQHWDQGALLKQMEIIGRTGRNWPVKDNRDQTRLVQSCLKSSGAPSASEIHDSIPVRSRGPSNALRDQMGMSREEIEAEKAATISSPFAGSKPRQRGFTEILGDEPVEGQEYSHHASPSKAGSHKNFQPMRLFDRPEGSEEEDIPTPKNNTHHIRPNPSKFEHFDFVDDSDPQNAPKAGVSYDKRPKSKYDSQWEFDDFNTPAKPKPSKTLRHQSVRHWTTGGEEVEVSPAKPAGKARRDAETHFEMLDDGEEVAHHDRPGTRAPGSVHNNNLGLYENKLFDRDDAAASEERALGNITNLKGRSNTFESHWEMKDESPGPAPPKPEVSEARKKVVKNMGANWSSYDQSPNTKENVPLATDGINIAGDGMGSRKGLVAQDDENQGINIAGDGMGSRKGTDRSWLYGGDSVAQQKPAPRKKQDKSFQSSLWDM